MLGVITLRPRAAARGSLRLLMAGPRIGVRSLVRRMFGLLFWLFPRLSPVEWINPPLGDE
jgi:hypothetical protein